ncbi:hypothetical protein [Ramlibacter sp.]|nr:hypothetical protein [Ramlibacter sp.]MBA2674668.1 hypothetical protein [Ramlibacter sp.]
MDSTTMPDHHARPPGAPGLWRRCSGCGASGYGAEANFCQICGAGLDPP